MIEVCCPKIIKEEKEQNVEKKTVLFFKNETEGEKRDKRHSFERMTRDGEDGSSRIACRYWCRLLSFLFLSLLLSLSLSMLEDTQSSRKLVMCLCACV